MGSNSGNWAVKEFETVDLGDERLNDRLVKIANSFSESPETPINQSCSDWAETKAAYRFFKNDSVDAEEILGAHSLKTIERAREHEVILAVQDTSHIMYTHHPKTSGLGKISLHKGKNVDRIYSKGLSMHTSLALTPEGLPLGILNQSIFPRMLREDQRKAKKHRNNTPIEEKESYRWLEALEDSATGLEKTQVVTVCDREADIYEFFLRSHELNMPVLVRANYDRAVNKRSPYQKQDVVKLRQHLAEQEVAGSYSLALPAIKKTKHNKGREERVAQLELRYGSFKLNPSKRLGSSCPDLEMSGVLVTETNPPKGVEPLEWVLLTNLPVKSSEDAYEKVEWYSQRWKIEMFHKVLKSGFRVEDCRLSEASRLIRYLTVMSIVAWRIFSITLIARTNPKTTCDKLLSEEEWKILYVKIHKGKKPPEKIPTLEHVVVWIARLGGFLARKSDGHPGTLTLWRGWKRLSDLTDGVRLAQSL